MANRQDLIQAARDDFIGRLRGAINNWIAEQAQQNQQEGRLFITDRVIREFVKRNVDISIVQNHRRSVTYTATMNVRAVLLVANLGNLGKGAVSGGAGGATIGLLGGGGVGAAIGALIGIIGGPIGVGIGAGIGAGAGAAVGGAAGTVPGAGLGGYLAYKFAEKILVQMQNLKEHINGEKVEVNPPQIVVTCTFVFASRSNDS